MTSDWARPIVHWSIEAIDPERQRAFYADLFHWEIGEGPFMQVAAGLGGPVPGPAGHIQGRIPRTNVALYPGRRSTCNHRSCGRAWWHRALRSF